MVVTLPPRDTARPAVPADLAIGRDRRRRGRRPVNPLLLPLLRGRSATDNADDDQVPASGNFRRCLLFTLVLAIPLWGLIAAACYWAAR